METTVQLYAGGTALVLGMTLSYLMVSFRHRRRRARLQQAEQQAAYDAAVTGFRASVELGLRRRSDLLELLEVAFAGRSDRALTAAGSAAIDAAVSRLYLDLALAGADHVRRESVLRMVRRGISDIEMLLPEVPIPPAPVTRLNRRTRRAAQEWHTARSAELDSLRALVDLGPHVTPVAGISVQKPAVEARPVPNELAAAS